MSGLKVIDGTPTAISKYLREDKPLNNKEIEKEIKIDLTRVELDKIMKMKFKGDSYNVRVKGYVPINIQEAITFFIEGYKTGFRKCSLSKEKEMLARFKELHNLCFDFFRDEPAYKEFMKRFQKLKDRDTAVSHILKGDSNAKD